MAITTMQLVSSTEPCIMEYMHTIYDSDADCSSQQTDYNEQQSSSLQSMIEADNN